MERKEILIFLHTEYHLMLSTYLIRSVFSDPNQYHVTIVQFIVKGGRRQPIINYGALPVSWIKIELNPAWRNKNLSTIVKELLAINYHKAIFFHEFMFVGFYLMDELSRKGSIISLCQDGLDAYLENVPWSLLKRIKKTLRIYYSLISNGLIPKKLILFNSRFAFLKIIDELLLTDPEIYINWSNKKLVKIGFEDDIGITETLKKLFKFNKYGMELSPKSIFYINQPIDESTEYEINLLKSLRDKFPDAIIYIKLHPKTPKIRISHYKAIVNCIVISTTIPAELYMLTLKNSIIISFWSTASLFYIRTCNYYWLYELLAEQGIPYRKVSIIPKHINVIKSIEMINFR